MIDIQMISDDTIDEGIMIRNVIYNLPNNPLSLLFNFIKIEIHN